MYLTPISARAVEPRVGQALATSGLPSGTLDAAIRHVIARIGTGLGQLPRAVAADDSPRSRP